MTRLAVAVDAMGGDDAPRAIVDGALAAARSGVQVILVGDEAVLRPLIADRPGADRVEIVHAAEVVPMDAASSSVRRALTSSIRVATGLVAQGRAGAVVSCGHSGAAVVSGVIDLGLLEGVERPGIATVFPRADGKRLVLLDAGANVDCKPEHMAGFALLGVAFAETLGIIDPRVGLLSIGEEKSKGNAQTLATLPLIEALNVTCVGNVEPHHALAGACDVIVCDGFVGNVVLKAAEGAVAVAVGALREELQRGWWSRFGSLVLRGAFDRFRKRLAWDDRGGALLLGVNGIVVIGHGRANPRAVEAAILEAQHAVAEGLITNLRRRFSG